MPDQAYMLPEEWERFQLQQELARAEAQTAKEKFLQEFPEYQDNAWHQMEVEEYFEFIHFQYLAKVRRISDGQVGWLSFSSTFPRIYFHFREVRS